VSAAFDAGASLGVVEKDSAHGLGGSGEEVGLVLPREFAALEQAEVGLVDEGGGLEGVVGALGGHALVRDGAELVVDESEEVGGGPGVGGALHEKGSRRVLPRGGVLGGLRGMVGGRGQGAGAL
jgi:hypothetical protein